MSAKNTMRKMTHRLERLAALGWEEEYERQADKAEAARRNRIERWHAGMGEEVNWTDSAEKGVVK